MLPEQFSIGLSETRYGDLTGWRQELASLPAIRVDDVRLDAGRVGFSGNVPADTKAALQAALMGLHPWRKGPFDLCGLHVDTEWRSDWKWDRLADAIAPLAGRRVLDVGCGNGYHCWRMLGAGAAEVIGIDPTPLFVLQFKALQHYLQQPGIHVLPMTLEAMPEHLPVFDTVFSMGVLYHRRDPMEHLMGLKHKLVRGGQLVLETLVIEGGRRRPARAQWSLCAHGQRLEIAESGTRRPLAEQGRLSGRSGLSTWARPHRTSSVARPG